MNKRKRDAEDDGDVWTVEDQARVVQYGDGSKVLVCKQCRHGVHAEGRSLEDHFRVSHRLPKRKIDEILYLAAQHGGTADPKVAELPADGNAPVEDLDVREGFRCGGCRFLTRSFKVLRKHQNHGGQGCTGHEEVRLQTWVGARYARYWIVAAPADEVTSTAATDLVQGCLAERLAGYEKRLQAEDDERRRMTDGRRGVDFESMWVREMGWVGHFGDRDKKAIQAASMFVDRKRRTYGGSDPTAAEEAAAEARRVQSLRESFDRVMVRCVERMGRVSKETLQWLASIDANRPHPRPFGLTQDPGSMKRYRALWQRYVVYCWRAYKLGRHEATRQLGIRFTDRQWTALDGIADMVAANNGPPRRRGAEVRGEGWDSSEDDDDDDEVDAWSDDGDGGEGYREFDEGNNDKPAAATSERDDTEEHLDQRVFEFCTLSLKQKIAVRPFTNPLLHFTAVLAIDEKRLTFRDASNHTPTLAGVLWCARLILLEHFFENTPETTLTGEEDETEDISAEAAEEFAEVHHKQWLADGSHSPVSTIVRSMTYGRAYREKVGTAPRITWEQDGRVLRFFSEDVDIEKLRGAAMAVIDEAEATLRGLTFGRWETRLRGEVDISRMRDSMLFERAGHSFLDTNKWLDPGFHMLAAAGAEKHWDEGAGRWKLAAVRDWLKSAATMRVALLAAVHIWGGQPGRGPEIMTLRWCDTQNLTRNVIIFQGHVMLITDRDKYKAIRGIGRKVARFLPDRLGKCLVAFIAWVMPLERLLWRDAGVQGPSAKLDPWLWKDARTGIWDTPVLTKKLRALTMKHVGVAIGVSDYRHIAIALGRRIQGLVVQQIEVETLEGIDGDAHRVDPITGERVTARRREYVFDLQATHKTKTAVMHYAVESEFPGQLAAEMVQRFKEVSRLWHQYMDGSGSRDGADEDENPEDFRARAVPEGSKVTTASAAPGPVSASRQEAPVSGIVNRPPQSGDQAAYQMARPDEVETKLHQGLRKLLGEGASWRSEEQHAAARLVLTARNATRAIIVLPTGAGKSVLFMLPSLPGLNGGVSIVVVPFSALANDVVGRAREAGIDCLLWDFGADTPGEEHIRVAPLVVVAAETATTRGFRRYADSLRARGLIKRVFVDECHTVITDATYRERLLSLYELELHDRPIFMLTATLPVRMEWIFRRQMLAEDAEIIRSSTAKLNIEYEVATIAGRAETIEAEVERRVTEASRKMKAGGPERRCLL